MKKTTIAFWAIISILILGSISLAGIKPETGFQVLLLVLTQIFEFISCLCVIALLIRPDKAD